jgi:hypothetical protein
MEDGVPTYNSVGGGGSLVISDVNWKRKCVEVIYA